MKLEAVVHPTSISRHDPAFDPDIHIAVEVLSSPAFAAKMIGVPVTAYHHDTMRAVDIMYARKEPLTASNMRRALIELHQTQPTAMELAKAQLGKNNPAVTQHSLSAIWQKVPEVIQNARGPGVFGSVTAFWRQGDRWLVAIDLDPSRMGEFQKRLVKQGGALGEVSLTHAVIDGTIEPLELSFTIQGLRTGLYQQAIIQPRECRTKLLRLQLNCQQATWTLTSLAWGRDLKPTHSGNYTIP
jgi:hypothetical protein